MPVCGVRNTRLSACSRTGSETRPLLSLGFDPVIWETAPPVGPVSGCGARWGTRADQRAYRAGAGAGGCNPTPVSAFSSSASASVV
ncbi:MAG: hypothetical protein K0S06_1514 [Microvirga sp.]|jgi:hypothetical protein|nr:hypothetical protein [Microvirga sp.]